VVSLVEELQKATTDNAAWPAIWWGRWRQRMAEFYSRNTKTFGLYWSDLVARAASCPAAPLLHVNLDRITMGAWSELLLRALKTASQERSESAPVDWNVLLSLEPVVRPWSPMSAPIGWDATAPWLAMPAVFWLGLAQLVEPQWTAVLNKSKPADDSVVGWVISSLGSERGSPRSAIGYVISAPENSITKSWPAPARYGGILLDRNRWLEIGGAPKSRASRKAKETPAGSGQCVVLVESGAAELDENQLGPTLSLLEMISGSRSTRMTIVPATAPEDTRTERVVIRDPKDFDEAMARALSALPSS
jgi:hypothetical protein